MSSEEEPLLPAEEDVESQSLPGKQPSLEYFGLALSAVSALMFSIMSAGVKHAGASFPFSQIVLFRSIVQMLCAALSCAVLRINPFGNNQVNRLVLVARGTSGAVSLACYFYTLTHMPLGDGTTLFFINPCLVAVAAYIFLGESMTKLDISGTALCLLGVVVVSKPGFIFGGESDTPLIPALVAITGASVTSIAYCIVRFVGKKVHFLVHVFYFGLASTVLSSLYLQFETPVPLNAWTWEEWVVMVGIGVTAFMAQCLLNASLHHAPAGPVALMRNLDIVCAFLWGMLLFDEQPRWNSYVGACMISGTTGAIGIVKWRRS